MSTHRNIDLICVVVTVLAIVLALLFMNGERLGIQKVVDQDSESATGSVYFTNNDLNGTWESGRATVITLKGDRAAVSGSGAYVYNGDVIINGTGLFTVSGTLDDGSIVVDAHKTSKVWIKLDGARIRCSDSAAFRVEQADKVFLTLAEGSENLIESGSEFSAEAVADNVKGALFSRDDLTINGSGSLTVRSGYRHAIAVNDDLVITGGTITAEAPRDAIHANDSFRLRDAELLLKGGDEGIDVDAEGGYFYMETGSVHIDCAGDGICSEGDVLVAGGSLTIASADDGIHSGTKIYIYGGTILLSECYEGLEAIIVEQHGGDVTIYPFDDGINANGSLLNGVLTLSGMDSGEEPETYVLIAGGSRFQRHAPHQRRYGHRLWKLRHGGGLRRRFRTVLRSVQHPSRRSGRFGPGAAGHGREYDPVLERARQLLLGSAELARNDVGRDLHGRYRLRTGDDNAQRGLRGLRRRAELYVCRRNELGRHAALRRLRRELRSSQRVRSARGRSGL